MTLRKRDFLALMGATLAAPAVWAKRDGPFIFAINEGVTYRASLQPPAERFADLITDLQKIVKRPVQIEMVKKYDELAADLHATRYDMAWVHPAHHAIRAMVRDRYQLVALTKGFVEYRASFMVSANSPLKGLADLKDHRVGAPDQDSITSVITRATLHESLGQMPQMQYVRYQDAVPFMVEHGLAACGVSASKAVVKAWTDGGGRVIHTSKPVPIKQLISSPLLPESQHAELTAYFVGLEQSADGKRRLESLKVPGFVGFEQSALTGIGTWLGV